jgi:hypothetical protein
MQMSEVNEVPTYQPPEGVHGPTLGRDLPDRCERALAYNPDDWLADGAAIDEYLYWWRFPPLKVGDRVQLTGTVERVDEGGGVWVQLDGEGGRWLNTAALTRVVAP